MKSRIFIFSCRSGNKNHLIQQNASHAPENCPNLLLNGMDISDPPPVCIQERQMGFCFHPWSTQPAHTGCFSKWRAQGESFSSAVVRLRRSRAEGLIVKIIYTGKNLNLDLFSTVAGGRNGCWDAPGENLGRCWEELPTKPWT